MLTAGWYTEQVFPGEYGIPKPWNFFLQVVRLDDALLHQPSYWTGKVDPAPRPSARASFTARSVVEMLPEGTQYGIRIANVTKEFDGIQGRKVGIGHCASSSSPKGWSHF